MTTLMTTEVQLGPAGRYMPQLDGVRAIAVALVLCVHCIVVPSEGKVAWMLRNTLSNGWIGVDLFFVLSGFLITGILLRSKQEPNYFRNFYMRRFLRIFPLYYALLLFLWVAAPFLGLAEFDPAWPYFTYTSNLSLVFLRLDWEPMGHAWSLAVEEQFYLLFPLVVLLLERKTLKRVLWIVVASSPLVRFVMAAEGFEGASYFATFCRLDVLAMGALIAIGLDERTTISHRIVQLVRTAFVFFFVAVLVLWVSKQLDFRKPFFDLVGLSIVDGACALFICLVLFGRLALLDAMLRLRWLVALGRVSYGIYLFHYPVLHVVDPISLSRFGDSWARTVSTALVSISVTVVLSAASWHWFERPILRLKDWFVNTPPSTNGVNSYASP